jgi:hypothetical protein
VDAVDRPILIDALRELHDRGHFGQARLLFVLPEFLEWARPDLRRHVSEMTPVATIDRRDARYLGPLLANSLKGGGLKLLAID